MKRLMKIGFASSLGLALALPACAENETQTKPVLSAAGTAVSGSTATISSSGPMLMGTLGTTSSTGAVAALVIVSAAEAVSSTGHTK